MVVCVVVVLKAASYFLAHHKQVAPDLLFSLRLLVLLCSCLYFQSLLEHVHCDRMRKHESVFQFIGHFECQQFSCTLIIPDISQIIIFLVSVKLEVIQWLTINFNTYTLILIVFQRATSKSLCTFTAPTFQRRLCYWICTCWRSMSSLGLKDVGFGMMGEQETKSIHKCFNSLGRTYSGIPNCVDRHSTMNIP